MSTITLIPLVALALGAQAASLSGVVKDPSGAAVAGATVSARRASQAAPLQTATDAQGRFVFDASAPGQIEVKVTKDGFETWESKVAMGGQNVELSVSLKLKIAVESITVSGKRSPLANSDPNYKALRGGKLTKVYRVENLTLVRDVGTFTFHSGSFSFLPPVLGQVATGVFVGDGNFQLQPVSEMAVRHLHTISGADAVNEDFTALVVYFSDSTFDEIQQHSTLADESPQAHEPAFQRVKDVLEHRREPCQICPPLTMLERLLNYEDIPNLDAEILAELYNPAQRGSFRAFMHGKHRGDLRFLVNPRGAMPMLPAAEEVALLYFDPASFDDGIWYLAHLASEMRAGRASTKEEKRLIAPEHYRIESVIRKETVLGGERDLSVSCDLRFRALTGGTRMIKFDMMPDLQVSRVTWDGKEIPFVEESRKQDGSFYLQTPEPLVKDRTYEVNFQYAGGEILQSAFPIPPGRIWYPTPASAANRATYDLIFHIPHGMNVASVGKLQDRHREDAFDVFHFTSDIPIAQAVFRYLTDPYIKTAADEVTGTQLSIYVQKNANRAITPESTGDILIDVRNALHVFHAWFGPPSFDSISVVVDRGTAAFPGLVYAAPFVTAGYSSLYSQMAVMTKGRGRGIPGGARIMLDEAFANDLSREWWGNTLGAASFHDVWLAQGFASFSASLYDSAAVPKGNDFKEHWTRNRELILNANSFHVRPNDAGPIWMSLLNDSHKTANAGAVLAVSKGGYVLNMLRSIMWDSKTGDDDFRALLRDYVREFANQPVATVDFLAAVEKHMKPSMDVDGNHRMVWFFNEWVYGTDVPSYRLEYSIAAAADGKKLVTGQLTQSGVSADFRMPVPIFGEFPGTMARIATAVMRGNTAREFKVIVPANVKRVFLNLNHDVLTDKEEVKRIK